MEHIPIYVKVDRYKELLSVLKKIDGKLSNVNSMIDAINELKAKEDDQIRQWNENLSDIQDRLERVSSSFYQN